MSALHELGGAELLTRYASGDLSPVEVTRAVIAHIERCEPRLQAMYEFRPEVALQQARDSEARWRRGEALELDGVPLTLKENIASAGTPVPVGSAATALVAAAEDAPPAARMREAGAVLLGKTTMPDFGMLSSSLSSFHPLTRNPWDLSKTPGGSSAGAGSAAAAGYGPMHVGTDIGGSVRLPAGWCGVFGLKPSLGRIPIKPAYAGRVAGPMTRTVQDAALMMRTLSRPDWRDPTSLPVQAIDWLDLDGRDLKGLRLGLLMDAGWGLAVEPETAAAVQAAARLFEQAGAIVEPIGPLSTRAMVEGLDRFWRMRSWLDMQALPPERRELVLPYIRDWVASGAALTATELFHGHAQIAALRDSAVAATQPFDFVLSPVSPVPAFAAELASPINDPQQPFEHIAFTLPFNMSEQPAASINCGWTASGLPIGLQVSGRRFDDLGVLQLCAEFERMRPAQRPWPESA